MDYRKVKNCRICGSKRLKQYLDLGLAPLPNDLCMNGESHKNYPLQVLFCEDCSLSQLSVVVNPEIMFRNYPYHSSTSETFKKHCYLLGKKLFRMIKRSSLTVIDIAANDGCLLEQFANTGFYWRLVGVEPAKNLSALCIRKGLRVENEFFSIKTSVPQSDVITAANVLAHVDDLDEFITAIKFNLSARSKSICVVEVPYLPDLIERNAFDTIYHEHLSYFLLKPLKQLFENHGMRIFKAERIKIHGGSLRIFTCLQFYRNNDNALRVYFPNPIIDRAFMEPWLTVDSRNLFREDKSVQKLLKFEEDGGFYELDVYRDFSGRLSGIQSKFRNLLMDLKNRGKLVAGYGASAKGIMMLNACKIGSEHLAYIVDDTPGKQGYFIPGSRIPIVSAERFHVEKPDYIALLSWNFSKELMRKTKKIGARYIVAIPEAVILN